MAEEIQNTDVTSWLSAGLYPWWVILLFGILLLALGAMFLMTPAVTTLILITFMGAFWFVGGLFSLGSLAVDRTNMGWKIFLAVLNIIAGAIIMCYPFYSTIFLLSFFVIFIGFFACFIGCAHLFSAFKEKDAGNAVLGIISVIFGLILLIYPLLTVVLLPFIAGALCIVAGISAIIVSFMVKKAACLTVS